jgi:hypothetical protein
MISVILSTSGFWPRVRARALRAPVFLSSLPPQTGRCAPPPRPLQLRCFLFDLRGVHTRRAVREWGSILCTGATICPNFFRFFFFLYSFWYFLFVILFLFFSPFFSFHSYLLILPFLSLSLIILLILHVLFFVFLFFFPCIWICMLYYRHAY